MTADKKTESKQNFPGGNKDVTASVKVGLVANCYTLFTYFTF